MAKTAALAFRVSDEMKAALESAAHDEERSVSSFVERVLAVWLRDKGYLEPNAKRTKKGK